MSELNTKKRDAGQATMPDVSAWPDKVTVVPFGRSQDSWYGLSRDLIDRFVDVQVLRHAMPRSLRRGCRSDLVALDNWMQRTRARTLVGARSSELRTYIDERVAAGADARLVQRLLENLRQFYRHVCETGCRNDNPARRLQQRPARACVNASTRSARH